MKDIINKAISLISPAWAASREHNETKRQLAIKQREYISQRYDFNSGKLDRTTQNWIPTNNRSDTQNVGELQYTRARAWHQYRNNPFANQVVRTIVARVIGSGLTPESLATRFDGSPFTDFQHASKNLYNIWSKEAHDLGRPGRGGMTLDQLFMQILKEVILSGEVLLRFNRLQMAEAESLGLTIPLTVQVIQAQRLVETISTTNDNGNIVFRGIELDKNRRRVAYWLYDADIYSPMAYLTPNYLNKTRVDAADILHIYLPEGAEHLRGVSWLAPVLNQMRDLGDFQQNELLSSTVAAMFALFIKRTATSNMAGLTPSLNQNTSDNNGNPLTTLEPMMVHNLAPGEEIQTVNPDHPNANAPEFVNSILRSIATGVVGVKPSAITGDYRNSSFSSETSNENDNYYQVQGLQNWFFDSCCAPMYSEMVTTGLLAGAYDGIMIPTGINEQKMLHLHDSSWRGPASRSINPSAYENAVSAAVKNGTSSLIIECAKKGEDWKQVLIDQKQILDYGHELELPEPLLLNLIGMNAAVAPLPFDAEDVPDPKP